MSTPEIKHETPQSIEERPEQVDVSERQAEAGIVATPVQPAPPPQIVTQSGATITTIPSQPSGPSIIIPVDPVVLTQQSRGSVTDASTWSAWYWLRMIKKALAHHIAVITKGTGNVT